MKIKKIIIFIGCVFLSLGQTLLSVTQFPVSEGNPTQEYSSNKKITQENGGLFDAALKNNFNAIKDIIDKPECDVMAPRKQDNKKASDLTDDKTVRPFLRRHEKLIEFVRGNKIKKLKKLLKKHKDLSLYVHIAEKPLIHYACEKNLNEIALMLINHKTGIPGTIDLQGDTEAHKAAKFENKEALWLTFTKQASFYLKNKDKEDVYDICKKNKLETEIPKFKLLEAINNNAFDYTQEKINKKTIGYRPFLQKKQIPFVNFADSYGNTPLHYAARKGNLNIIKLLIYSHAWINAKNKQGKTSADVAQGAAKTFLQNCNNLIAAAEKNNVKIFTDAIKNLSKIDNEFDIAVLTDTSNCRLEELLIKKNAMNIITSQQNTQWLKNKPLLHYAVDNNNQKMVTDLLSLPTIKSAIDKKCGTGFTPLYLACQKNNQEIIKILWENGANPNIKCVTGKTPLELCPTLFTKKQSKEKTITQKTCEYLQRNYITRPFYWFYTNVMSYPVNLCFFIQKKIWNWTPQRIKRHRLVRKCVKYRNKLTTKLIFATYAFLKRHPNWLAKK